VPRVVDERPLLVEGVPQANQHAVEASCQVGHLVIAAHGDRLTEVCLSGALSGLAQQP